GSSLIHDDRLPEAELSNRGGDLINRPRTQLAGVSRKWDRLVDGPVFDVHPDTSSELAARPQSDCWFEVSFGRCALGAAWGTGLCIFIHQIEYICNQPGSQS